ncbi:MAG: PIN domain-containing protein [Clostridia bacterium]|nr:PIN domain-containing protein [Clostridia bacterium]
MRVLIDTNLVLTYVSGREDKYSEQTDQIMKLCAEEKVEGFVAFHTLSTVWYIARKLPNETRRDWIIQICELLTLSGADNQAVLKAVHNLDFKDFEDALQDCCAQTSLADYIVTANIRDFAHSDVPAVTPDQFLKILS